MSHASIIRTAAAILRITERSLSEAFRVQAAQMVEALGVCMTELEMVEAAHKRTGQPFYSQALELSRQACSETTTKEGK